MKVISFNISGIIFPNFFGRCKKGVTKKGLTFLRPDPEANGNFGPQFTWGEKTKFK